MARVNGHRNSTRLFGALEHRKRFSMSGRLEGRSMLSSQNEQEGPMERKQHWEKIYSAKPTTQLSWYQPHPEVSLELIKKAEIEKAARIIDVGGGASTLADELLSNGYKNITVLDVSSAAIRV